MPPFLLPVIAKLLETQLVPFLEWAITGCVRLLERRYARKGTGLPGKLLERPTVAAVASRPLALPPDARL